MAKVVEKSKLSVSELVTSAQFWQLSLLFGRHRFTS